MKNRYECICYRYGGIIRVGRGILEKVKDEHKKLWGVDSLTGYLAEHPSCASQWAGTARHYRLNPIEPPLQELWT